MLATLTTAEAHRYLIAFLIAVAGIGGSLIAMALAAIVTYKRTTRACKRYPALQRQRPEPERPVDLDAARREHLATCHRNEEARELGRTA
jgi:hypothetical protein